MNQTSSDKGLLIGDETADHAVQVVEEGQEIKAKFDPSFFSRSRQFIAVHNSCWVIKTCSRHDRSMEVTMDMISDERDVDHQRYPFSGKKKHDIEK